MRFLYRQISTGVSASAEDESTESHYNQVTAYYQEIDITLGGTDQVKKGERHENKSIDHAIADADLHSNLRQ
jgi:hypothetical protein